MGIDNGGFTAISLPALLFSSLLVLAIVTYLLRRHEKIMALVAALYSAFWAIFYWQLDLTEPVWSLPLLPIMFDVSVPFTWLSLTFQIQPDNQSMLLTIFGLGTLSFALATRISQGRGSFLTFGYRR